MEGCSDNCYPGTTILVNKLNIHNQKELDIVEKQITLLHAVQAEQNMSFDNPNLDFYHMRNLNSTTFFTNLLGLKMWCC